MTRRDVARIGLGVPGFAALRLWAASAKEFWNNKPASDWSKSEIQDLLNRSPWAKEVNLSDFGHGIDVGGGGQTGGYGNLPGGGVGRQQFAPPAGKGSFRATVRWDSALPIREALHLKQSKEFDQNYIIAVSGDIPDVGQVVGVNDANRDEQRLENLRQYTRLERKGDPIPLSRISPTPSDYPSGGGNLFYFERRHRLGEEDKQVMFVTKVGSFEIKARFNLKEMQYRGKLEI